jgi:hypothetical protein
MKTRRNISTVCRDRLEAEEGARGLLDAQRKARQYDKPAREKRMLSFEEQLELLRQGRGRLVIKAAMPTGLAR